MKNNVDLSSDDSYTTNIKYELGDSEMHPEYRSVEEKVEDFFREGEKSLYYGAFLKRLAECDQLLENNFLITKMYVNPKFGGMDKVNKLTTENSNLVYDIVKEMIENSEINI